MIIKSPPVTLQQIARRLEEQALETAALRSALDTQFTRIAQMQAELDGQRNARNRARALPLIPALPATNGNGNGNSH